MVSRSASPAETARTALLRLAELGLAPTPENYSRFYNDIAGISHTATAEETPEQLKQMVSDARDTVGQAASATASLADLIQDHNAEIRQSLDSLTHSGDKDDISLLLNNIVNTASTMYGSVAESREQLNRLADTLKEMREEMAVTRRLQEHDQLTGAQNRQSMDNLLAKEVNRACSYGGRLTIALLDLDNIGQIGKQYGDGAADRILIHVANITKAVLRQNDYLVRYSGEEFLLVLPDTEISGCRYMIDRLRQVFHKNPVVYKAKRLDVTFSAGIAQLIADEPAPSLILRADLALRRAQANGIDQTEIAEATSLLAD